MIPRHSLALSLALLLVVTQGAFAQQRPAQAVPHIGYSYPAGGRQGTSFQITIGGQFLDGVSGVHFSGTGVKGTIVEYVKPVTQGELNRLRDKLQELMERKAAVARATGKRGPATKATWTPEDEKQVAEIRKRMATFVRKPSSPAIMETVTVDVTMTPDAEPGLRELRLQTPTGMTNPMVFLVGQLPEFSELDAKSTGTQAETNITLPAIVNGRIMPGDIDRIRFKAKRGERLVVIVSARELIPYIPDAVPGWFQATIALYDSKGKELAYADDFRFNPDPVLYFPIPVDGDYVLEVKDSIFRGREDFVYRIAIGELPFITGVYPLGAQAGTQTPVELKGWNLPSTRLNPDTKLPGLYTLSVRKQGWVSNLMPFAVDPLPDVAEVEPNNVVSAAQAITPGVIINGRIEKPGDWDVYRFEGKAGQQIVAEVYARRLGSPVDSILRLTDSNGKQLALNDDSEDKGAGLYTHHADSRLMCALPASGTYYLHLGDTQGKGSPDHAYRLRISPPQHDFELRVVPSSIIVRGGATVPITIHAIRKDGFAGDIEIALKGAPPGFALSGARVPAGQDQVRLTITAPAKASTEPFALSIEGRATIQGRPITRTAVPAEDMMQAFAYHHLVPAKELEVAVSGKFSQKNVVRILSPTPVRLAPGGSARVVVGMPGNTFMGRVVLELSEAPEGISIRNVASTREGTEFTVVADAAAAKPGTKGNLIVNAFAQRDKDEPAPAKAKNAGKRRTPLGTLPAIPFEITGK